MMRVSPRVIADLEMSLLELKNGNNSTQTLQRLKKSINNISEAKCKSVVYTTNKDKPFFGMAVVPVITNDQVYDILCTDSDYKVEEFYLELDSRLFESYVDLNGRELTAVVLHELGHINNENVADPIRDAVALYLAETDDLITTENVKKYNVYYRFGILDAFQKMINIFNKNVQEEIKADSFCVRAGYGEYLESALGKIYKAGNMLNSDVDNRFIVFGWMLRVCKDFNVHRIPTIKRLERARKLSGSDLEKSEIEKLVSALKGEHVPILREAYAGVINEKHDSFLAKFKRKGIRGFEDDYAEFSMRARNVDREDDAIIILRGINNRMGIIDDYLYSEDLDEKEKQRWTDLYNRYSELRNELATKKVYRLKNFGIYVNYPDVQPSY